MIPRYDRDYGVSLRRFWSIGQGRANRHSQEKLAGSAAAQGTSAEGL